MDHPAAGSRGWILGWRGQSGHPAVVAVSLLAMAATASALLRVGYTAGMLEPGLYSQWNRLLFTATLGVGVVAAGYAGYDRVGAVPGVLVGVAPAVGLLLVSVVGTTLGVVAVDTSQAAIALVVGAVYALPATVAWLAGRLLERTL